MPHIPMVGEVVGVLVKTGELLKVGVGVALVVIRPMLGVVVEVNVEVMVMVGLLVRVGTGVGVLAGFKPLKGSLGLPRLGGSSQKGKPAIKPEVAPSPNKAKTSANLLAHVEDMSPPPKR
jgi:hypothetical protein